MTQFGVSQGRETRYYTGTGRGSDHIVRCVDCRSLVLLASIHARGCCECGNKRFREVTTLTPGERDLIVSGALDFPHREQFLAEFEARE